MGWEFSWRQRQLALAVCFLCSSFLHAANLGDLFDEHFHKHYRPRHCGENILKFAEAIKNTNRPTDALHIVTIENQGFSVFGMVNAEKARGERFRKPAVVETNWYHHVILIDDAGLVYDFDYTTTPTITPIEDYIEDMFLDETECQNPQPGEFCGGRDSKLQGYVFEAVDVDSVLDGKNLTPKSATMGEVLRNWKVLIR